MFRPSLFALELVTALAAEIVDEFVLVLVLLADVVVELLVKLLMSDAADTPPPP